MSQGAVPALGHSVGLQPGALHAGGRDVWGFALRRRRLVLQAVWDWRFKGHSVFRQLQLWFGQLHTSDPKHLLLRL